MFCINCLNLSHESQLCGVAVATGHSGGEYSYICIYIFIYLYSISYFLLFSSIFFLLSSTPTSHLSFSSLFGFSLRITLFLLFLLWIFTVFLVFPFLFCFSCNLVLLQCHSLQNCDFRGSNNQNVLLCTVTIKILQGYHVSPIHTTYAL